MELSERHPDLDLELVTSPQSVRVARREADLFLSFFKLRGTALDSHLIGRFKTGLFASKAYLERNGVPCYAADLREHRFVGYIEELVQLDSVLWLEERAGSVCLNSFGRFAKWISASVMPPPSLVPAR
ncbi:LysR substrate-binding domain-containing protein (plasmid) [Neorhizobium galegae]|nr:LysR substrate-binding domain-containing protein [Neorhizobium galegae]UIK08959.1 LysR substrate-binding domain-containing protein [Neorhizobium galegae]